MLGFPASLAARGNIVAHISTIMGNKGTFDLAGRRQLRGKGKFWETILYLKKKKKGEIQYLS